MKEIPDIIFEKFSLRIKSVLPILNKKKKVIVAVSGGPDSMFLLYILHKYSAKFSIQLVPVYINHKVRTHSEIKEDIKTINSLCKQLRLCLVIDEINTKKFDENTLRELRYKKLYKIALKHNSNVIATGHTKNDIVETFIFNLCRGSGLKGLCGIPFLREIKLNNNKNLYIVRPIIDITKEEIINTLKNLKISYVVDKTNLEINYKRNFVRHKILPLLKQLNNNCEQNITFTSELINHLYNKYQQDIEGCLKKVAKFSISNVYIDLRKFLIYNDFTKREILYRVLSELTGKKGLNIKQGVRDKVEEILKLLDSPHKVIKLTKKLVVEKVENKFLIFKVLKF